MRRLLVGISVAAVVVGTFVRPHAQAPAANADHPAFEVASVKPNKSGVNRIGISGRGGQFTASNVTLELLIQNAYRVQGFQVVGGPDWMRSDRFDINAKTGGIQAPSQTALMLQALLADRFKLTAHHETREAAVYGLVLAKPGVKGGPQLKASECAPGPPTSPTSACGAIRVGPGVLNAQGIPLANLITFLSNQVNRVVIDKTALTGTFDVDLKWAPDPSLGGGGLLGPPPPGPPGAGAPPPPSDAPSIFTAIQEQLGLKLDSQRGPVDVLVIDHVDQPTED